VNKEPDTLCSLRSFHKPDNSEVDVAELAGLFGGGGHRNASGFTMTRGQFNKQWLNRLHLITEDKKEGK
jgi:nanoRNase/pAp phosphatase (c-di-AMP/oligoRNAs hydrolase)